MGAPDVEQLPAIAVFFEDRYIGMYYPITPANTYRIFTKTGETNICYSVEDCLVKLTSKYKAHGVL